MQHPIPAALAWSAVILVASSIIATRLFRQRTTE
jgi:hypothetical protein